MKPHPTYLLLFLLLILAGTLSLGTTSERNNSAPTKTDYGAHMKLWSDNDKLTWSDFKGRPDKRNAHDAVTTSTIKTFPKIYTKNKVEYEIVALFDQKKSWTKSDSEALLVHEQLHFDISELVLRRFRKKFSDHKLRTLEGVNKMINSAFDEASKERNKLNREYDKETDHSQNKRIQLVWQERIERELKTLEDYSSIVVTITK